MTAPSIGIIGAGYVGLVTGVGLSTLGHLVRIADRDEPRIAALKLGKAPIFEPGLEAAIASSTANHRLEFSTSNADVAAKSDILFVAVPTPMAENGAADLSFLETVLEDVVGKLPPGACIVVKSTIPPGSTRRVEATVRAVRDDVYVVSNPEFLTQGRALENFLHPHRIVIGASDPDAGHRVAALYTSIDAPILVTDATTAEMVKYASNTFLATKVSFINSVARLCDHVGASVDDVITGLGLEPRIGRAFLNPGPGFGGSCLPKDTAALAHLAEELGLKPSLLSAVLEENAMQLNYLEDRVVGLVPPPASLGVWGLTFKAGTDDLRDSPAVALVRRFVALGYDVTTYDPMAYDNVKGASAVPSSIEAAAGAELLIVLTEWPEFAATDFDKVATAMSGNIIVDGRNVLDPDTVTASGIRYLGVGRLERS